MFRSRLTSSRTCFPRARPLPECPRPPRVGSSRVPGIGGRGGRLGCFFLGPAPASFCCCWFSCLLAILPADALVELDDRLWRGAAFLNSNCSSSSSRAGPPKRNRLHPLPLHTTTAPRATAQQTSITKAPRRVAPTNLPVQPGGGAFDFDQPKPAESSS